MIISHLFEYLFDIWNPKSNIHIKLFILLYLFHQNLQDVIYNTEQIIYLYPEKDLKIKDVCAISGSTKKYLGPDIIYTDYVYLKSHCGKNEKCYETEEGIFQCGEKILLQKIGDDCGINEECFTGMCSFGRCTSIPNDEDCTVENDPDNVEKVCNPGNWCYEYDVLNHLYKCVSFVGEGEYYDELNGKLCQIGLEPFVDATLFEKCTKIGTVETGIICPNELMCKSGSSIGYENEEIVNDDSKRKCFTTITDSKCEYSEEDSDYICRPIVEGLDIFTIELSLTCKNIDGVHVCPYSIGKENSFKEYISALNSIDINEVYGDEHKYHLVGYGDNDLSKAFQKYKYYDELYSMGLVNDDGSINEDKEDEWEFFWRFNNSNFINISNFFFLIFLFI